MFFEVAFAQPPVMGEAEYTPTKSSECEVKPLPCPRIEGDDEVPVLVFRRPDGEDGRVAAELVREVEDGRIHTFSGQVFETMHQEEVRSLILGALQPRARWG